MRLRFFTLISCIMVTVWTTGLAFGGVFFSEDFQSQQQNVNGGAASPGPGSISFANGACTQPNFTGESPYPPCMTRITDVEAGGVSDMPTQHLLFSHNNSTFYAKPANSTDPGPNWLISWQVTPKQEPGSTAIGMAEMGIPGIFKLKFTPYTYSCDSDTGSCSYDSVQYYDGEMWNYVSSYALNWEPYRIYPEQRLDIAVDLDFATPDCDCSSVSYLTINGQKFYQMFFINWNAPMGDFEFNINSGVRESYALDNISIAQVFDYDGDGRIGTADNCPYNYNPNQENKDGDAFGDVCDSCPQYFNGWNYSSEGSYFSECPAPWGPGVPGVDPVVIGTATDGGATAPGYVKVCLTWNANAGQEFFRPDKHNVNLELTDLDGNVLSPNCLYKTYDIATTEPIVLGTDYCVDYPLAERFPDLGTITQYKITAINYSSYISDPWRDPSGICQNPIDGMPATGCKEVWTGVIPITPPAGTFSIPLTITGYSPTEPVQVTSATTLTASVPLQFTFSNKHQFSNFACSISIDGAAAITGTPVVINGINTCTIPLQDPFPTGVYSITATVTNTDTSTDPYTVFTTTGSTLLVVYDPNGGFVTGGGSFTSPVGAYVENPTATGRANFGFVSKYLKGAKVPTGETEFQFKAGDLKFNSTSYDWLGITNSKATYKGTGALHGEDGYKFTLTAIDGGKLGVDKIRIKISESTGRVVYDNQIGAADDADPTTVINGGSIIIYRK